VEIRARDALDMLLRFVMVMLILDELFRSRPSRRACKAADEGDLGRAYSARKSNWLRLFWIVGCSVPSQTKY
jgi:hypothetical protein